MLEYGWSTVGVQKHHNQEEKKTKDCLLNLDWKKNLYMRHTTDYKEEGKQGYYKLARRKLGPGDWWRRKLQIRD